MSCLKTKVCQLSLVAVRTSEFVTQTWSVGQFFDVDGYFDEDGMMIEVEKLYRRFEAGKFDKADDKKSAVGGGSKANKKKKKN